MTLATFAALDALAAAFDSAEDLPTLKRNDTSLDGFTDCGAAGVKFKFAMEEGDFVPLTEEFGDPPQRELAVQGAFLFAVEGQAGEDRDTVFRAGVAAIAGVLMPEGHALRIDGKFEDTDITRIERRLIQAEAGREPIDLVTIDFALFVTAPTPFG
jgi:hypothetical protein